MADDIYSKESRQMPIIGLTDEIQPEYPRLGKLRKGAKKKRNGQWGEDLTYFRFTSENEDVVQVFTEECGTEPTAIEVYLPHATTEENFPTWKEKWNGSGTMLHRCDGEKCVGWHDDDGYHTAPLGEGPPCPGECKEVGRLQVIIPALIARGYIGTVCAETHGKHDVLNISRALKQVEQLCNDQGGEAAVWGLRRVGFTLYRSDCEVSSPAWKNEEPGKRHKVTKSLVKIVPSQQWAQAQMLAAQEGRLALPEPDGEEDPGDVVEGIVEEIPAEGPEWPQVPDRPDGDDNNEPVVTVVDPALKEALEYTTKSGVVLGQATYDEIEAMLNRINAHPDPGPETLKIKGHVELLLTTAPKQEELEL